MSPWLVSTLVTQNLPHLLGILIYGAIAIVLALACYILFSKVISLNTGLDASPQDRLSAVILAVGIVIGISLLVAITAYKPPKIPAPAKAGASTPSAAGSSCGNCGQPHDKQAKQLMPGPGAQKAPEAQQPSVPPPPGNK